MIKDLNSIENVKTIFVDDTIIIQNSNKYQAKILLSKVKSTEIVVSLYGEKGFKMTFKNNNFLIVTPEDYVFNIKNIGLYRIQNLPEIITLNGIIENAGQYIKNPEPNNNIDNTVALYLLNKILLENAELYNFDIRELKQNVREAALKTDAIDDLTIYD